ncbi:MAG: DEAD/DEAH box helicase [Archaeoglobaceae archaeon]|nr:DEAD/DEAH box helicase [Archaeoglobaceae archaeon]MCX8152561.1 DEAD/DEAH box helicase [Archaeoglobaceae archaeon]MDW8014157.1 DEAD/DEAH box helicase [Archaeoglobaceae archaeon]
MSVDELEKFIGKFAVNVLKEIGIKELFPPQREALKLIMSEKNILLCMPTASGKTLLAEIAMVRKAIEGFKSLYISPLKAIANEKFKSFKKWEKIGLNVGISTGDYSSTDEHLKDCDIIVTTYEKADSLIRNKAKWLKDVRCLVVDEVHLIDDFERGDKVEVLIAKMVDKVRIIALSATIKNYEELADWLNADCYYSEWRPVPLLEGYYVNGYLYLNKKAEKKSFLEIVEEGTLIFEQTRKAAESTALKLAEIGFAECRELEKKVLEENDGEMSRRLAKCVSKGVAFHHAGLLPYQRELVEESFREGEIKVVVATPTLAAGVNLPAKKVIIKSLYRYEGFSKPIKIMEYKQMAGRAGRPGCDFGVSILFASSKKLAEKYINGEVEPITSKLAVESKIRFHTLSLICENYSKLEDLKRFYDKTLFRKQRDEDLGYLIENVVLQLENWGMVKFNKEIFPTELGRLISKLYIDPLTGFLFQDSLREDLSEIGILHLICRTPDMERLSLKSNDYWVEEKAYKYRKELIYYPPRHSAEYDWFLEEVKTAFCLMDWINEVDEERICQKYSIAPGDLRRIVETAEWLGSSLEKIADLKKKKINISTRIRYGIREELLDLVELHGIGRIRARKLFNAGIRTKDDLLTKRDLAERLLGYKVVENAIRSVQKTKT